MTGSEGARTPIGSAFCARPARSVARALLGRWLITAFDGVETIGRIVETEAYLGAADDASHAAARIGRTQRNASMFGPGGIAYVYRSYGVHWCLNVVTGQEGHAAAVLIRAVEPVTGEEAMRLRRRKGRTLPTAALGRGPGNLTAALGITGAQDGHPLDRTPLVLARGMPIDPRAIAVGPRIGITRAVDLPLRFWVRGHPCVSRNRT